MEDDQKLIVKPSLMQIYKPSLMEIYKNKILRTLINGRYSPESLLNKDFLPLDLFKELYKLISKYLKDVYVLQYLNANPEGPIYLNYSFKEVECGKCKQTWSVSDYKKGWSILFNCSEYNKFHHPDATLLTINCGCISGQCNICSKCNPLRYVPRSKIFYCQEHTKFVFYSKSYDLFSNMYKGTGAITDMKRIKNDETLINLLHKNSIEIKEGARQKDIKDIDKEWRRDHPLPKFDESKYKDYQPTESEDESFYLIDEKEHDCFKKYLYIKNSKDIYKYEWNPLASPFIKAGSNTFHCDYVTTQNIYLNENLDQYGSQFERDNDDLLFLNEYNSRRELAFDGFVKKSKIELID